MMIVVSLLAFIAISLMLPISAFAIHETNTIKWEVVILSSYPACSNYHFQMVEKYNEISEKYFEMYQIEFENNKPKCMLKNDFEENYQRDSDLDLLILIYDRNLGREDLHRNNIGGMYSHVGDEWTHNHTIIFCDCSNFKYSDPVWILSHELSHFILYYLGYEMDVVEEIIHQKDQKYDYCVEHVYNESCKTASTKLKTEYYSYEWTVMAPHEPAIGTELFEEKINEKLLESPYRTMMLQETTKWWLEGKINDFDYAKSVAILSTDIDARDNQIEKLLIKESKNLILTEPPKDSKGQDQNNAHEKNNEVQKMALKKINLDLEQMDNELELPLWFKTRAMWLVTEQITEKEFIQGMEFLFRSQN